MCVLEPTLTPSPVIHTPDSNNQNSLSPNTPQAEQPPSLGSPPIPLYHVHCPGIRTLEPTQALSTDINVLEPKQSHTLVGHTIDFNQSSSPRPKTLKCCLPYSPRCRNPKPPRISCKRSDALTIGPAKSMGSSPSPNQPLHSPGDGTLEPNRQISPEASVLVIQLRHNNCSQEANTLEPQLSRELGRSIVDSYGNALENSLGNE